MITGWKKATITTSSGTYTLNNIAPALCKYDDEPATQKNFDGYEEIIKERRKLIIAAYDFDSFYALENDSINYVTITHIEIEGLQQHIYWKEAVTFLIAQRTQITAGSLAVMVVTLQLEDNDLSDIYTTNGLE
jgi:hypothetical protein